MDKKEKTSQTSFDLEDYKITLTLSPVSFVITASNKINFANYLTELHGKNLPQNMALIFDDMPTLYDYICNMCAKKQLNITPDGKINIPYEITRAGKTIKKDYTMHMQRLDSQDLGNLLKRIHKLENLRGKDLKEMEQLKNQLLYQRKIIANLENRFYCYLYEPGALKKFVFPQKEDDPFFKQYKLRGNFLSSKHGQHSFGGGGLSRVKSLEPINGFKEKHFSFEIKQAEGTSGIFIGLCEQDYQFNQSMLKQKKVIIEPPQSVAANKQGFKAGDVDTMTVDVVNKFVTWFHNHKSYARLPFTFDETVKIVPFVAFGEKAEIQF